jgi:tetratricopeptide (TPR) repeat protein
MICPNCKNEKWSEELCPQCGLDQKAALLAQGDLYQQQGRALEAEKFYEQYLRLDPDQWDVLRKRAIVLYGAALASGKKPLFDRADQALALALDKEWDWEQGHQFRINLFYAFGDLKEMEQVYSRISQEIPPRKELSDKILQVIQLTEKFANPDPPSEGAAPEPEPARKPIRWLYLLLFTVPLWLWLIQLFLFPTDAENLNADPKTLFIGNAVLSICGVGMILVGMIFMRPKPSNVKNPKAAKKSELNFPEE